MTPSAATQPVGALHLPPPRRLQPQRVALRRGTAFLGRCLRLHPQLVAAALVLLTRRRSASRSVRPPPPSTTMSLATARRRPPRHGPSRPLPPPPSAARCRRLGLVGATPQRVALRPLSPSLCRDVSLARHSSVLRSVRSSASFAARPSAAAAATTSAQLGAEARNALRPSFVGGLLSARVAEVMVL